MSDPAKYRTRDEVDAMRKQHDPIEQLRDLLLREGAEDEAVTAYEKAMSDPAWERVAQQRIWKIHPPETEEEKLKREFFGGQDDES